MTHTLHLIFGSSKDKKLREAAVQLQRIEFPHESVNYVLAMLKSGEIYA